MSLLKLLVSSVLLCITLGCSVNIDDYEEQKPSFDLFEYFEGNIIAYGMVQDYTGKQTRRFEVELVGYIVNGTLILDEYFVYDDGEQEKRTWKINREVDGEYSGHADGVIGIARGKEVGNAVRWQYDFELVAGDDSVIVEFDDWLYRQDEKRVFNLAKIKKFGIQVGTVTLFFEKVGAFENVKK